MTLSMGNTDKLAEFRAEAERLAIKVEPPSINRSGVEFDVASNTIYYALAALRGVGRQAVESIRRGARRAAVRRSRRFRPPHQSARGQQARAGEPHRRRRLRRHRAKPRRVFSPSRTPSSPPRSAPTRTPRSASRSFSAALPRPRRSFCPRSKTGCRRSGCSANTTPSASSSAAIRSTIMPPRSSGCACNPGRNLRAP